MGSKEDKEERKEKRNVNSETTMNSGTVNAI